MVQDALNFAAVEWTDAAQAVLEQAERFDTTRGLDSIGALRERHAPLYQMTARGRPVAYYVLEVNHYPHGKEAVISAAAAVVKGCDLTTILARTVELQCAGAVDCIMFHTRRPGLVKKATRLGFLTDGIIMRKSVNSQ